jgi:hypothetical protein
VLAPLAVYAAWALWARRFDQSEFMPSGAVGTLGSVFDSARAVIASLTGLYGHAPDVYAAQVGPDAAAAVPAALALAALVAFYLITRPPARAWAMLAALAVYWGFIALADRPEDLSRYMFGGALLLLLVAAEAAGGRVRPLPLTAALAALLIVSLPASLAKIADGRELQLSDTRASRSEYAMLELAGDRAPPGYTPALDPAVRGAAPAPFSGLDAASYRRAARDVGSLAYPLDELRALPQDYREAADITLAEALGLERRVRHAGAPADASGCREADTQAVELPAGGALVRALGGDPATLSVARFAPESAGVRIGTAPPGRWTAIELPPDAAPDPWLLRADHALRVCPTRRV